MRYWYWGNYPDGRYIAMSPNTQVNLVILWGLGVLAALVAIAVGVWT